ncbi:GFA family protein [Legionella israelensis]|nr:GFA family protein [Legionella israelensis]
MSSLTISGTVLKKGGFLLLICYSYHLYLRFFFKDTPMSSNNNTKKQTGTCLCGQANFEIEGDFDLFLFCHCTYCQKDTGSIHGANLISNTAKLNWLSGKEKTQIYNLEGTRHTKCFCQVCGSALPYMYDEKTLVVPAGSIDFEPPIAPTAHIFYKSRAKWEDALAETKKFNKFPTGQGE